MAETCSIEGCEKPVSCRGWCAMHWTRWRRYGSPLASKRPFLARGMDAICRRESDTRRFWSKVGLPDENGCMLWLAFLDSDGYGKFRVGRHQLGAYRVSLWLAAGPPASPDLHAAHSCRNKSCVAPAHLRWATHLVNEADKLVDGTLLRGELHPRMKVTDAQALEIRRRYEMGGITYKKLADQYGVHHDTVGRIIRQQFRFREEAS